MIRGVVVLLFCALAPTEGIPFTTAGPYKHMPRNNRPSTHVDFASNIVNLEDVKIDKKSKSSAPGNANDCWNMIVTQVNQRMSYDDFILDIPTFSSDGWTIRFYDGVARGMAPFNNTNNDAVYELDEENNEMRLTCSIEPADRTEGYLRANVLTVLGTWVADPSFTMSVHTFKEIIGIKPDGSVSRISESLGHSWGSLAIDMTDFHFRNDTLEEEVILHIQREGVRTSARDWVANTVFDAYLIPALAHELDVDPFGICGDLIPPP